MSDNYPTDLLYTKDHEWARVEGSNATIGISKFAVDQLGNITLVELPKEGETFKRGDVFGTVESVKAVSDVFAPLSGKVVKVNDLLKDSPEYVNDEPYDEGWMVQIELSSPNETKDLMNVEAYQKFLEEHEAE
jgi:glycine cleavage system H protein